MIKDFLMRKVLASKLKNVPEAEREKMMVLVQNNPDLFQKFAAEVQAKIASGEDQMAAVVEVMKEHEAELKDLMK